MITTHFGRNTLFQGYRVPRWQPDYKAIWIQERATKKLLSSQDKLYARADTIIESLTIETAIAQAMALRELMDAMQDPDAVSFYQKSAKAKLQGLRGQK